MFRKLAVDFGKEGLNPYHGVLRTPAEIYNKEKNKLSFLVDWPSARPWKGRVAEFRNTCARCCKLDMFYLRLTTTK